MKWIDSHEIIRKFLSKKGNTIEIDGNIHRIANDKHRKIYLVLTYLYYFLVLLTAGLLSKFLADHFSLDLFSSIVVIVLSFISIVLLGCYLLWAEFKAILKRENN